MKQLKRFILRTTVTFERIVYEEDEQSLLRDYDRARPIVRLADGYESWEIAGQSPTRFFQSPEGEEVLRAVELKSKL